MIKKINTTNKLYYFPENLTKAFNKSFHYPLTIITAPIGYGKTTAVRSCISRLNVHILWLSIFDSSKTEFWNSFSRLFKDSDIECCNSLLRLGFPEDSGSLHIVLTLINNFVLNKRTTLVIDDFHLAENSDTIRFITYLVINEIPNFNIILISRFLKHLKIEELSLKGYLFYMDKEFFKFSPKEIIAYFKLCNIKLTTEEADHLYLLTEGWITALYLILLNYKNTGELLLSFELYNLVEQVGYEPFSDDCKKFLLFICVYDGFTKEMANLICPYLNTDEVIAEITFQNSFIEYDNIRNLYFIHAVFANFLTTKLQQMPKAFQDNVYSMAMKWYMQNGDYVRAMNYAYLTKNFNILLEALVLDKGNNVNGEHKSNLIKYFEDCPIECKKNNLLAVLMYARHMFTFNEVNYFKKSCNDFLTLVNKTEFNDNNYKNNLLAEYELLTLVTQYNDINKMAVYIKRACDLLNGTSVIFNDYSPYTFGSPSILYLYYRKSGFLLSNVNELFETLPYYCSVTGNHGIGADEVMKAECYYNIGDFQNSEICMHKAYQKVISETSGVLLCIIFINIRLSLIKGNLNEILELFQKLRGIYKTKPYVFVQTIDLCEAYIFSILRMNEKVQPWVKNGEIKNTRLFAPAIGFMNIVYGKVLIENKEYLKLIGMAEEFLNIATIYPNPLGQIYTYIYLSRAYTCIYRYDEAVDALNKALLIASPDKLYMPFVENLEGIKQILEEIYSNGNYRHDISSILSIYKLFLNSLIKIKNSYLPNQPPSLTKREKEIALLAAQGLSNKEICRHLFVSENTVKTQLKNIFVKLDINSRTLLKQKL